MIEFRVTQPEQNGSYRSFHFYFGARDDYRLVDFNHSRFLEIGLVGMECLIPVPSSLSMDRVSRNEDTRFWPSFRILHADVHTP